jgi:hypothetical protein
MILEGIVTTISPAATLNIAPMGPRVDGAMDHLVLRPFPTSHTYRNLKAHPEGVFHVTDDVLLLARAALGPVEPPPVVLPASRVRGFVLADACRNYEFRVVSMDERNERVAIEVEVVHAGRWRDFFGFNRAKHAVVEAAILATRTSFLPLADIEAEFRKLATIIDKTGGDQEHQAFELLRAHLEQVENARTFREERERHLS